MPTVTGGAPPTGLRLNLGGEGEEPGFINQQPLWRDLGSSASRTGQPLRDLVQMGHPFLFCDNTNLPFPDSSVDEIVTNGVPIDRTTPWGPGIPTSEIKRVLKSGGTWTHDGVLKHTEP